MLQLQLCECPTVAEQGAVVQSRTINPTLFPGGVPCHDSREFLCIGIWIQNPSTSLTLYFGYGTGQNTDSMFEIAPGADKYFGVINEIEKVVNTPKNRLRPNSWRLQSTAAMTAKVCLFI